MSKRKRIKKRTVFGVIEGKVTEKNFLQHLQDIYLDEGRTSFRISPVDGGGPDRLISVAVKYSYCYEQTFVWLDEDLTPSSESYESLHRTWNISIPLNEFMQCPLKSLQKVHNTNYRNPVLVVSQPVCVEALILRVLGKPSTIIEYEPSQRKIQIDQLKASLAGIIKSRDHLAFYKDNLSKSDLEMKRKEIPELELLVSILTSTQPG